MENQNWITIRDAAKQIGVHQNTIRNWILRGDLKAERIGRIIRVRQSNLDALFTPFVGGGHGVWK